MFTVSWVLQTYAGWKDFASEAISQGHKAEWIGEQGYIWRWLSQTIENWQSEFLQLLTFVSLTAIFIHKRSHESKDNDDNVSDQLDRIESLLKELKESKQ